MKFLISFLPIVLLVSFNYAEAVLLRYKVSAGNGNSGTASGRLIKNSPGGKTTFNRVVLYPGDQQSIGVFPRYDDFIISGISLKDYNLTPEQINSDDLVIDVGQEVELTYRGELVLPRRLMVPTLPAPAGASPVIVPSPVERRAAAALPAPAAPNTEDQEVTYGSYGQVQGSYNPSKGNVPTHQ
jgi:hypothetical protein